MLILQKGEMVLGAIVRLAMFYQSRIGFLVGIRTSSLESIGGIPINVF